MPLSREVIEADEVWAQSTDNYFQSALWVNPLRIDVLEPESRPEAGLKGVNWRVRPLRPTPAGGPDFVAAAREPDPQILPAVLTRAG